MTGTVSRRRFLTRSLGLGCSLAASPLVTPVTMASAPWDNRLVVIILRGGLDGLDAVRPYGAAEFKAYRSAMLGQGEEPGDLDLDGYFSLHPAMSDLLPLWKAGELSFAHAVSTPYRNKRSHFDGQDILEAGTALPDNTRSRDGWLNRMLTTVPGIHSETAYAIGREAMLLTRGSAPVAEWSPDAALALSPQAERLLSLVMHDDPLFQAAADEAMALSDVTLAAMETEEPEDSSEMVKAMAQSMQASARSGGLTDIAEFAAGRLREDSRIAAYSIGGYDTHANQLRTIPRGMKALSESILTLKAALGPVWGKTTVVAMTEFGRTARANGTKGTDHGTGGMMVFAGGAIRGARVVADWPGLSEADLYQRRDLMPTRDVRAHTGWVMRQLFGLDRRIIEDVVFPGVELGDDPKLVL